MKSLILIFRLVIVGVALCQQAQCASIVDVKRLADGEPAALAGQVVTFADTDSFYIEDDRAIIGVRVNKAGHGLQVGMRADVEGTMQTDLTGNMERYVAASSAVQSEPPGDNGTIPPRTMGNNGVGGADWFYNSENGAGQKGATDAVGLNTVGLLVKTWGRYEQLTATTFSIDDGGGRKTACSVPPGFFLYPDWKYVVVTGVVSLYKPDSTTYQPVVLVTRVEVMSPTESVSAPGAPTGEEHPVAGAYYAYSTTSSTCTQGHQVEYSYTWGDGTSSAWSSSLSASHTWSEIGAKTVTVTARCQTNPSVSATSPALIVNVVQSGPGPGPYPGDMVYIPAGSFLMGNSGVDSDALYPRSDEFPQHSVSLPGYWIAKHEVTRGEYRLFMDAGGYSNESYWSSEGWTSKGVRTQPEYWAEQQDWSTGVFTQTDSYPVVGITYYEAEAFCNWAGGHLPTEAQWEKAARWNGASANVYPWGNTWDGEKCNNYWDHSLAGGGTDKYQTAPVESYTSGVGHYGCEDMAGNVWEWVQDWYVSYPGSSAPFDYSGSHRVLRGGSFFQDNPSYIRCAFRGPYLPGVSWYSHGFRFAR